MTEPERPAVLSVLAEAYRRIGAALSTALADTVCATDGPYQLWREIDLPESEYLARGPEWLRASDVPQIHPLHVLAQAGELAAVSAANALRGHVALLGRAYWPDLHDSTDPVIQHPAIYPPARAILEASAEVRWLLEPKLSLQDRARASSELLLWSQVTRRRPEKAWQDVARAAGFDVRAKRKRPDAYFVRIDERSSALTMSRMIRVALGADAVELYAAWSGSTHPDPTTLAEGSVLTQRDGGWGHSRLIREDEDVVVAANVASLIAEVIECQAAYWGRSPTPSEEVRALHIELAEWAPVVTELVNERNSP